MDHSAILPNGKSFEFWEVPVTYKKEIHVNQNHPMADDANEGTLEKPLKTINAAAKLATAGSRVLIHGGEYRLNPELFKGYNPFCAVNILHDRLFIEYEKTDMTTYLNRRGMIFCDGKPLQQVALYNQMSKCQGSYWVEANGQTVHFRLPGDADPSDHKIEITCREQCFAPEFPFLSYIKVKEITCAHAATGAPVPQRGSSFLLQRPPLDHRGLHH